MDIPDLLWKYTLSIPKVANHRIGAVIVNKKHNRIISFGRNRYKTHPLQARYGHYPFLHAEIDAIRLAKNEDIENCSIWLCRIKGSANTPTMELGLARPCKCCMDALIDYNLKDIYYSNHLQSYSRMFL